MKKSVLNLMQSYVDSYNARDIDKIIDLYADNATVEDPVGSSALVGSKEIEIFWKEAFEYDMVLKIRGPIFACGREAAVGLGVRIKTEDQHEDLTIMNVITYTDDMKIKSVRSFYDTEAMARAVKL